MPRRDLHLTTLGVNKGYTFEVSARVDGNGEIKLRGWTKKVFYWKKRGRSHHVRGDL